jgi:predicted transcriptional regulator of viral defense system
MKSRIKIAQKDIIKYFEGLPDKVLKRSDIDNILSSERDFWRLTKSMTTGDFIGFLVKNSKLRQVEFPFPNRKEVRYIWGDVPLYEILMHLKKDGYLSHFTAVHLHGLTDQIPKTIYLNVEQKPPKNRSRNLDQESINKAFKRKVRVSKNFAKFDRYQICVLNSMGVDRLGVVEIDGPEGEKIHVTNIERTLIDISVRPVYSGGVHEVLETYRRAGGSFSVNRLSAMLKKMDYIYPYHQVIGFFMEKAGVYDEKKINLMQKFEIKYDFYLTHAMKEMEYSDTWKLYFPKGF